MTELYDLLPQATKMVVAFRILPGAATFKAGWLAPVRRHSFEFEVPEGGKYDLHLALPDRTEVGSWVVAAATSWAPGITAWAVGSVLELYTGPYHVGTAVIVEVIVEE
jgi:hypothetical protein